MHFIQKSWSRSGIKKRKFNVIGFQLSETKTYLWNERGKFQLHCFRKKYRRSKRETVTKPENYSSLGSNEFSWYVGRWERFWYSWHFDPNEYYFTVLFLHLLPSWEELAFLIFNSLTRSVKEISVHSLVNFSVNNYSCS